MKVLSTTNVKNKSITKLQLKEDGKIKNLLKKGVQRKYLLFQNELKLVEMKATLRASGFPGNKKKKSRFITLCWCQRNLDENFRKPKS
jgi:hypothetical protein